MINGVRFAESVRTWLQSTDYQQPDLGLSVGEAMDEARQLLTMARAGVFTEVQLEPGPRSIDVLHALCRALNEANESAETVGSAYDLVSRSEFLEDEFDERHQLLAHLAFLAWDRSRLEGDHPSMSLWQDRCRENVTAQETIRNFLALPVSNRSPELSGRFLADPPVMLALCGNLSNGRNSRPSAIAEESAFAYRWLTTFTSKIEEWSAHLAAEAAISAGASSRHLGRLKEAEIWAQRAETWYGQTSSGSFFQAHVEYLRLCLAYTRHRVSEVLDRVPHLIAEVERMGAAHLLWHSRFLEALALKDAGRFEEALPRLEALVRSEIQTDQVLIGLALCNLGEVVAKRGDYCRAMSCLQDALTRFGEGEIGWAVANLQGVLGEVLRDQGRLTDAIESYRASIATYCAVGLEMNAAYIRIVLAETLLAAGRDENALSEILAALPVIEREEMVPDRLAAFTLLRESVQRLRTNPFALRSLREYLDRMQSRAQS